MRPAIVTPPVQPTFPRVRTNGPANMESEMKRLILALVAVSALGLAAAPAVHAADDEQSGTTVQAPSDESAPSGNVVKDDEQKPESDTQSDDDKK
jgi:hypothetical protein